jgi:hypothetical protein
MRSGRQRLNLVVQSQSSGLRYVNADFGDGRRFRQARRFKSAADSQSALKRTGCSSNPL